MAEEISSNEQEDLVAMLDKHVNALQEHFEHVHIFVGRNESDKDATRSVNRGGGNWYARFGQISEWLVYEKERIRVCARDSEDRHL